MDSGYAEMIHEVDVLEYRINQYYRQAERELQEKIEKYYKDFDRLDQKKKELVNSGKLSEADYKTWRHNKIMTGKVWEQRKDVISRDLYNTNYKARNMVYDELPDIYASAHNFATYQIENGAHVDTSYTLYNKEAVERLIADNPDMIPYQEINKKKDISWNKKNLQAVMIQGVLQGESIPHLAKRLSKTVVQKNRACAIRNARTMATSVYNGGKMDAFKRAKALGIDMKVRWRATFDDRTRDSHRRLDGEVVEVGQPFSNGLTFPCDMSFLNNLKSGGSEKVINFSKGCRETYNCRCTIQGVVKGLEPRAIKYRSDKAVGIPYEEWKKGHKAANEYRKANGMLEHDRKGKKIMPKGKIEEAKAALNKTDNLYNVKIADILGVDSDNIKITALPKEVQENVLRAVEKSVLKCPQLKGWLKEIEFSNEVKEPALAQSYSFNGKIRLGSHFLDADGIKREIQFNSDIQHMIQGANIESVVMHEIGHQIDALMTTKGIANATISQYGMIRTSHEVQREVLNELGFFDYIMESRKDLAERYRGRELNEMVLADRQMWIREHISEYASENNNEFWAELFAEYMCAEKPREAAQVFGNIFEKLLKEL